MRQGLVPVAIGCAIGGGLAGALGGWLRVSLFRVAPVDPLAIGGTAVVLLAIMIVASVPAAFRTALVNPLVVLREE